jgi:hypothetical protein
MTVALVDQLMLKTREVPTYGIESRGVLLEAIENVLVIALHGSLAIATRGGKSVAILAHGVVSIRVAQHVDL